MELEFDRNMKIVRRFRPYINQEEKYLAIYNPEGGPYYGLYSNNYYTSCPRQVYYGPK